MTLIKTIGGAAAGIAFFTAPAAMADVTAAQVWENWKSYLEGMGYTVEGQEAASGGALTVTDLTMSMSLPDTDGAASIALPRLNFSENGDGTVSVTLPNVSPMTFSMDTPEADDVQGQVDYIQNGFVMTVSGVPDNMVYDYSAEDIQVVLTSLSVEGQPADIGAATMTLRDIAGRSTMQTGNLRTSEQSMTAGSMTYELDFADPEKENSRVQMKGQVVSLDFAGTGSFPTGTFDPEDMGAMIAAGFAVNGAFSHSGGQTEFTVTDPGQSMSGATKSASGGFSVRMDAEQLRYGANASGVEMTIAGGDIPFPVEIAMADSSFDLQLPVTPAEDPQDFGMALRLGDFVMSDMIWGLFDPSGQLPRDPATIALDLAGKATLDASIFDPAAMEGAQPPGELRSLTIRDVIVRLAGAELTGKGDFTFDNSDTTSFDGMPRPEGALNLRLEGGNTLLDTLVAMGLLPEEQATGMRMMMGLFAVPGDGEDTLTSTIEVNEQGHVLANGQRLK